MVGLLVLVSKHTSIQWYTKPEVYGNTFHMKWVRSLTVKFLSEETILSEKHRFF